MTKKDEVIQHIKSVKMKNKSQIQIELKTAYQKYKIY